MSSTSEIFPTCREAKRWLRRQGYRLDWGRLMSWPKIRFYNGGDGGWAWLAPQYLTDPSGPWEVVRFASAAPAVKSAAPAG